MKEFKSIGAFVEYLATREAALHATLDVGLEVVAAKVEQTAKAEIGVYQPEVGPFPAWAPLAEFTVNDRLAQGYSPDDPLLREGNLRESITHEVGPMEAVIGSDSEIAVYQELGTVKIPPRPFLGPAVIHEEKFIKETLGTATVAAFAGEEQAFLGGAYKFTKE